MHDITIFDPTGTARAVSEYVVKAYSMSYLIKS